MKLPWWVSLAALLLGAGTVGALSWHWRRLQAVADRTQIQAHEATIASLRTQVGRLDTVYVGRVDTLRLIRTRWDTLKSVLTTTDTVVRMDTLRLVVRVADSVIAACSAALETCDQRTARYRDWIQQDSLTIRALSRDLARARLRSRLGCTVGPGATTKGLDYVAVACGVRIF